MPKVANNITAPSPSGPVIARSATKSKFEIGINCTPKQSHLKKYSSKNFVLDDTTNFQTAFHPRPKGALHFSGHSGADGLATTFEPWVARSEPHLRFDGVLVRDRLPRAIDIYPLQGTGRGGILKRFRIGCNGLSGFGNPDELLGHSIHRRC